MKKKYNSFVIPTIGLLLIFFAVIFLISSSNRVTKPEAIAQQFNESLLQQGELIKGLALEYRGILNSHTDDYWPLLEPIDENKSHFVFIYRNSELLYWNTSSIFLNEIPKNKSPFIVNISNSWFLADYSQTQEFEIFILKPIVVNYNVENQYINKYVNPEFSNIESIDLVSSEEANSYKIDYFNSNNYFLTINSIDVVSTNSLQVTLILLVAYLIFVLLVVSYLPKLLPQKLYIAYNLLTSIVIIFVFRWIDWYYGITIDIINTDPLKQQIFSSPLISNLWDLLITSSIIIVFIVYYYKTHLILFRLFDSKLTATFQFIYVLILLFIPYFVLVASTTVLTSSAFYEVWFLFTNISGFVLLIVFILFGLILYLLLRSIHVFINSGQIKVKSIIFAIFVFVGFVYFFCNCTVIYLIISIILLLFAFLLEYFVSKRKQFFFLHHLIYIVILSALFSFVINQSIELNKNEQQSNVSTFLNQSGSKEIEDYWKQINSSIINDSEISTLIETYAFGDEGELFDYFTNTYFSKLAKGTDIQVTICSKEEMLNLENEDIVVNCHNFFQDLKLSAISTSDSNLFLISNEPDNIYYLGELRFSQEISIYIEFYTFYIPTGLGYTELLVDRKKDTPDLSEFSFAKYHQNILISKFGAYEYHTTANIFGSYPDNIFFDLNGFKHYKIISGNGDILIVSRQIKRISSKMISFSILVLLFTIFFLLLAFLLFGKKFRMLFRLNFRARLQLFFMTALISILFSTAVIILYYANINSKAVLETQLNEKAHSVLIELQHKLSNHKTLETIDKGELGQLLQKFSLVFFSDINVYDTQGKIVASSRPQIFEEGFLSEMVNPRAFEEIFVDNLLYYNCTEKIGDLEYFSSYLPLMLTAGDPAGIINLPYFARQKEQRQSFRLLLFTFINLFVILGILGIIIAIFYSRLLTKPLTELQQNIANIRIDMQNEKIKWQSDDEIGQLINEYNAMVDKLEASAEILKRSEREIAWREVARQIAHEIKNPLTPMKLNIQYLEKSYGEKDNEFGTKLKDISHSLIQQIDTLDKVAEMFSDMAKSNIKNFKQIDLLSVIESTVKLFEKSSRVVFEIDTDNCQTKYFSKGVRKDIVRVFNNLLKNSVEAIEPSENGKINISISSSESYHTVKISDNGSGIPKDKMDIIFTPYFTTRSKGTGLGLAIVKTIINDMGGSIKLDSTSEDGTTFVLKFLKSSNV